MPERFNPEFWAYVDQLVAQSQIIVDRPKDSPHPEDTDTVYPVDYGYLAGTTSSDGSGIDVWLGASGEKTISAIICTIDLVKRDSEIKILMGCTEDEMLTISHFLNRTDGMRGLLIRRITD